MKIIIKTLIFIILLFSCFGINKMKNKMVMISEKEILTELDLSFYGKKSSFMENDQSIKHNFFIDLENGYFCCSKSKIHLFADSNRWAIVFEQNGYHNRQMNSQVILHYIGNCIKYNKISTEENIYTTNTHEIIVVESKDMTRIKKKGDDFESFEVVSKDVSTINIRGKTVKFDYKKDNKENLYFCDLIRDISDNELMQATKKEIQKMLPSDIKKIMTIDSFHQKNKEPSTYETYKLISKILFHNDSSYWKPSLPSNNHWSNWNSGDM